MTFAERNFARSLFYGLAKLFFYGLKKLSRVRARARTVPKTPIVPLAHVRVLVTKLSVLPVTYGVTRG